MDFYVVLQVAAGLATMYLLLSLFGTVINETIARIFSLRADHLATTLAALVDDKDLKARFDADPLMQGVARAAGTWKITHLPSETFVAALLEQVRLAAGTAQAGAASLDEAVAALPESNIKRVLARTLSKAAAAGTRVEDELAGWFDSVMDHAQAAYARRMHLISFLVGVVLAAGLNADTIQVASQLWRYPTAYAGIQAEGAELVTRRVVAPDGTEVLSAAEVADALTALPLGWTDGALAAARAAWPTKVAGLLLTALAIALGAPFWFDTLSRFVNIGGGAAPRS